MKTTLLSLALLCAPLAAAPDTVDTAFAATAGQFFDANDFGGISSVLVQPDGKILFGSNEMSALDGTKQVPLVRFNPDGTVDSDFAADNEPMGSDGGVFFDDPGWSEVHALGLQSDGKIIAAGVLQGYREGTQAAPVNEFKSQSIVRFNADATIDLTFQTNGTQGWPVGGFNYIEEVTIQPDDKIICVGGFGGFRNAEGDPYQTRYGIARLNADGSLDTSFQINPADFGVPAGSANVRGFFNHAAVDGSGDIYVAGFMEWGPAFPADGQSVVLARLNSDGSRDFGFNAALPGNIAQVNSVVLEPNGEVTVLGRFESPATTSYMQRFTTSGSISSSFTLDSSLNFLEARPLRRDPNGKFLVSNRANGSLPRNHLVRLNNDGSVDPTFDATALWVTEPQNSPYFGNFTTGPDGKIYSGSFFDEVEGVSSVKLVAFEGDVVPNQPGVIQFQYFAASASECDGQVLLPVTRAAGSTGAASVYYSFTANLNATAGADFDATGGTINFAAGEAGTKFITIPLVDDSLVETFEVFTANLSNATGAALGTQTTANITIIDGDSSPEIVAQPQALFVPPFDYFQLVVGVISGKEPTTYQWFKDGVAIPGATSPLYFQFDANASQHDGEYCVEVTNPNGTVTSNKVDVVVKDPAEISFAASSLEVQEDDGTATLTLTRMVSSANPVSVGISLTNNSASSADYSIAPTTVSWADGDSADKTVTITLTDDSDVESPETFIATLVNYSPDSSPGAATSVTVTILDDDSPLTIDTQPISQSLQEDEELTLTVAATSQTALTYQWFKDGVALSGETADTLTIDPVELTGAGTYTVEVTNAAGTVTSDPAVIEISPAPYLTTTGPAIPDLDLAVYSIALIDNQTAWVSGNSSTLGQVIQKVSLDPSITPVTITLNAQATEVINLPDGGVAARGDFTTANGQSQSYLAKFNPDGSLASGQIASGITFPPTTIAVDSMGRLLIGEGGGDLRRYEASGTQDLTFPQTSFGFNPTINTIEVVGSSIYVGGRFTSSGAGTAGNYLTKLNDDGTRDESFAYNSNRTMVDIKVLPDGRLAVLNRASFGTVSYGVHFLSQAGVFQSQLPTVGNIQWFDFDIDDNEFIYVPRVNNAMLTRQNDDGSFNSNFGGFDFSVHTIEVDEAGRAWVGGNFTTLGSDPVPKLVIINGDPGELAIVEDPALAAVDPGASATFSVNAVSSGTLAYQWRKDGIDLVGETSETLTIDPVSAADAALYDVMVTNTDTALSLASQKAELVVLGAPDIRTSPSSTTLIVGEVLTLEAEYFAQAPVTFQWQKDGIDIPGATNPSLALSPGALTDSGSYTLIITNGLGSATTDPANIQFIPDPAALVDGFANNSINFGYAYWIAPTSDGSAFMGGTLAGNSGADPFNPYLDRIADTGSTVPAFAPVTSTSSASRNTDGALDSMGRPVVVNSFSSLGFIVNSSYEEAPKLNADGTTHEPFTTNANAALSGTWNEVAIDSSDRVYVGGFNQLRRLNADGTLDTSFSATFSGTPIEMRLDATEKIVVLTTNSLTRYNSDGTLDTGFTLDSSIPINPAFVTFDISADDNLHLAASNSSSRRIYKIAPDGSLIETLTNPGYTNSYGILDMAVQPNGKYLIAEGSSTGLTRVLPDGSSDPLWNIGDGFNSAVQTIELTEDGRIWVSGQFNSFQGNTLYSYALLNGDPVDVIITSQPMSLTADVGTSGSLSVAATGLNGAPVTFQWQKDGVELPGETGTTLNFPSLADTDEGLYEVVITNTVTGRDRKSAPATITVLAAPELVAYTGDSQDLEVDDELTLSVEAVGAGTLTYQWQKDGVDIPGATDNTFTIAMTDEPDSGSYRVVITNGLGSLTTDAVAVTVVFSPAAINSANPLLTFNSTVEAILPLPDGRTLVGGAFSSITDNGTFRSIDELALINADGTLDLTFDLNPNGSVFTLAFDTDGGILVGGRFSFIGGQSKLRVARLNPDLTLDNSFGSNIGPNGDVYTFEATTGGRYYVGGIFNQWDGNPGYLVRLNSDGSFDDSFEKPALNTVEKVIPLAGGKVLAAGGFNGSGVTRIARFNEDGSIDTTLPISSNRYLFDIAIQADGKIVAAGQFGRIVRYNSDGTQDSSFSATANSSSSSNIKTIAIDAAGKILVGGTFTQINGEDSAGLARLNPDGTTDTVFTVREGVSGGLEDIALQPLGKIWLGGSHTSYRGEAAGRLTLLNGDPLDLAIARQPSDAIVDPGTTVTFSVAAVGTAPLTYQWTQNGVILVDGGDLSGTTTDTLTIANAEDADEDNYQVIVTHSVTSEALTSNSATLTVLGPPEILAQPVSVSTEVGLSATFNVDAQGASPLTFQWYLAGAPLVDGPGVAGATTSELVLSDLELADSGSLFVRLSNGLGTLDSDAVTLLVERLPASLDRTVVLPTSVNSNILAVEPLDDGSYIIGGQFTFVGHANGSTSSRYLAKLDANGALDTAFAKVVNGSNIRAIESDGNGKFLIGGRFTSLNADGTFTNRTNIARLNSDGSVDTTFDPGTGPNSDVYVIRPLSDGKILVAGNFSSFNGQASTGYIVRLNADGSVDNTFVSQATGLVQDIALVGNDYWLNGGSSYNGNSRNVRIDSTGAVVSGFSYNGTMTADDVIPTADGGVILGADSYPYLEKVDTNGTRDTSFPNLANNSSGPNNRIYELAPLGTTRSVVAGQFTTYSGITARNIMVLDSTGVPEPDFQPGNGFNGGYPENIKVDAMGRIWCVGNFFEYKGEPVNRMAVLNGYDNAPVDPITAYYDSFNLPPDQRDDNDNTDRDAHGLLLEYLYGMDPTTYDFPPVPLIPSFGALDGASLNTAAPGAGLDPTKSYRFVQYRLPKDMKGLNYEVEATRNLSFILDGSLTVTEYGTPIDDGDYQIHSFYFTPDTSQIPALFWRLTISRP